jgi:hypothetical protein
MPQPANDDARDLIFHDHGGTTGGYKIIYLDIPLIYYMLMDNRFIFGLFCCKIVSKLLNKFVNR